MILSRINNIELKSNILLNSDHNCGFNVASFDFYQAIFNACKKKLLNQEINFDNISTKKKKKDTEDITSINFLVNNLLNIFNKKNIKSNFYVQKNTNIKKQKKKIDQNFKLKLHFSSKNKNTINIEDNRKIMQTFKKNEILNNLTNVKNKYFSMHDYNVINYFKKPCSKNNFSKINHLTLIKNKKNSVKASKNSILFKNHINSASHACVIKNLYKNHNFIYEINSLKKTDKSNFFELNKKSTFFLNNKKSLQWKKAISQQVLLSISNKDNRAEIRLTPMLLGTIYVKIKIKNNQAQLKLISDHIEIKNFLNSCIPFLHDSLIKNGIFLKKVNISNAFDTQKNRNLSRLKNMPRMSSEMQMFYKNFKNNACVDTYV
ncbi:flagellar hook-length control protein FliK [Buchnera aphidicola]|uniref:flagellar hook-length control protein FliK n=1 Tax=Buchnera aphidicola TaxID=9 RepID=UPI0006B49625|nr:flagellar hook-length control protein FliK [Buchnera aphidicola]